jgi:hypothetical protein
VKERETETETERERERELTLLAMCFSNLFQGSPERESNFAKTTQ